jgi:hypothetical protein
VRHTHNVRLASRLMTARLFSEYGCAEGTCDFGPRDQRRPVCLHKQRTGKAEQAWIRIVPALENTYAASEGWAFTYQHTRPHSRGAFRAVVFV